MELFNSTISSNPLISSVIPKFPFKATLKRKNSSKVFIPNSTKLPLRSSFSICLPLSSSPSRFRISASSRRPTSRQNYLRKKLTEQQQVSRRVLESNTYNYSEKSRNLDANSGVNKFFDESAGVKETELESKSKLPGESVLWNKLEGWVEQYKKDIDFWGIGTGPIFTVYKDYNGKVEKVVVNDDEILRRSGLDPLSYMEAESDSEVLNEVNSRISYAKTLAREMESGNDVLPGNSSVAKYVASGRKSGTMSLIQRDSLRHRMQSGMKNFIQEVTVKPDILSKLSRTGIMVVFGIFVISSVKRMIMVGEDRQGYTSLEKEMLRRKIKARMEKEKNMKGSVEVIDHTEPTTVPIERPQLDKQELMNNIRKVQKSNGTLVFSQDALSVDFEQKIQEIRTMARHARELEKGDTSAESSHNQDDKRLARELGKGDTSAENSHNQDDKGHARELEDGDTSAESSHNQDDRRHARELQKGNPLAENSHNQDDKILKHLSKENQMIQKLSYFGKNSEKETPNGYGVETEDPIGIEISIPSATGRKDASGFNIDATSTQNDLTATSKIADVKILDENECPAGHMADKNLGLHSFDAVEVVERANTSINSIGNPSKSSVTKSFRIIRSVEEAREYLSKKHDKREPKSIEKVGTVLTKPSDEEATAGTSLRMDSNDKMSDPFSLTTSQSAIHASEEFSPKKAEYFPSISKTGRTGSQEGEPKVDLGALRPSETESSLSLLPETFEIDNVMSQKPNGNCKSSDSTVGKKQDIPAKEIAKGINQTEGGVYLEAPVTLSDEKNSRNVKELAKSGNQKNWIEKNFHELEPIAKKIAAGFRDHYVVAKEKTNKDMSSKIELMQRISDQGGDELEWMKDERLREIVFKVRDNELAGRDPFHLMDNEEKLAFFSGLEKKVEQENAKLLNLHEWVHSNIENLDYGADGISVYDPPEKIIPRWKGPPIEKIPEFLKSSKGQKKPVVQNIDNSDIVKHKDREFPSESKESLSSNDHLAASAVCDQNTGEQSKSFRTARTVIEGSDGSIRPGKKSGKEFWQHTKKWSRGFLESYNAEPDPEIKAVVKDIGKDLDRWITEKEIKEAADLMDKLPERGQQIIKEKLEKVKREMEMFGPHAVVSKYREYSEEKEEDYLWWLDLPYVLCIELYTEQDGKQEAGFYSLEMAADLELDPKQYHVVAFEDAGDCKNFCCIIQAHMQMLGKGNAFVVARPPKDAFRDAKANGFGVTVIRKGQLQLNVDQTLEQVEELISEVGSKIYHDKIMQERSLDIRAVMKGVFGLKKPIRRRRSKRKLKKPTKS